jgi:outer membrane protein assembly factor BamA
LSRSFKKLSPLSLTGTWDQTDLPFTPTKGFIARGTLEHASAFTLSQFRYNRAYADAAVYHTIGAHNVLAGHLRLGVVNALASTASAIGVTSGNLVHPRKRFYAGGSQSVRGYGENQLGPKVLTIPANTLRGRIIDTVNAVVDTTYRFCAPTIPIAQCNPNAIYVGANGDTLKLKDSDFQPRPLGGNSLLEGSIELRFPIWRDFGGAVFVDGGLVGGGSISTLGVGTGAITPGAGLRYRSPVGPIRIDVGYNPYLAEDLQVVTENDAPGSSGGLVTLGTTSGTPTTGLNASVKRQYPRDRSGGFRGFLDRLTLHLSIGEAF